MVKTERQRFLGVYFASCNTYGRLYLRSDGKAYLGRCPKCGAPVRVKAARGGANVKMVSIACKSYG